MNGYMYVHICYISHAKRFPDQLHMQNLNVAVVVVAAVLFTQKEEVQNIFA